MGDGDDEADIGLPTNFSVSVTSSTVTPQQVTLGISNATICGNLTVNLGNGDNWLQEGSTQVNGCEVVAGCNGDDRVEFKDLLPSGGSSIGSGVIVKKDLTVNLGGGDNYLNAYDLNVCGSMCVTGSGTNEVYLAVFTVGKRSVIGQYLLGAPDRTAELARWVDYPVLVLYGEDDDKWEPAVQDTASQLTAERVCIPAAAHSPAVDAPETTASALNAFWHAAEVEAAADGRDRAAGREARARQL